MGEAKCDLYEHTEAYILAPVVDSLNAVLRGAGLPECERSDLQEIRGGLALVEAWGHRIQRADPLKAVSGKRKTLDDVVADLDDRIAKTRAMLVGKDYDQFSEGYCAGLNEAVAALLSIDIDVQAQRSARTALALPAADRRAENDKHE